MSRQDAGRAASRRQIMAIKYLHSLILLGMSTAVVYILFCGLTGRRDSALWIAIGLILFECLVFLSNRSRCPLTTLAIELGDSTGNDYLSDRLLPQAWIRYTVPVCGGLFALGLATLALSAAIRLIR